MWSNKFSFFEPAILIFFSLKPQPFPTNMQTTVFDLQPENQKAEFDFLKKMELDEVESNPKESEWTEIIQRTFWMFRIKRMFRHQFSRTRVIRNALSEQEVNDHKQRSTRPPFNVFLPTNDDRFDAWGG